MSVNLVLTVIGDDRPGLVGELATVVSHHQGNWLESSMSHLAGKFAGILRVAVASEHVAALTDALGRLERLRVLVEQSAQADAGSAGRRLRLTLVGHDRIGIVREVSQILARHALNVEALDSWTSSAPMSAETLFHAEIELAAPTDFDARALQGELERISDDLMVDIVLNETIRL